MGCGSNNPCLEGGYIFNDPQFEPHLCRVLHLLGAKPIGIDIGSLEGELFQHYRLNLNSSDSLRDIPDGSIDLANACQLFDSSFLRSRLKINPEELKRNLLPQLERVLKPGAYFLHWSGELSD